MSSIYGRVIRCGCGRRRNRYRAEIECGVQELERIQCSFVLQHDARETEGKCVQNGAHISYTALGRDPGDANSAG